MEGLFASGLCKRMSCVAPQGGYFSNLDLPGTMHMSPMYLCLDCCHSFFLCNEPGLSVSRCPILGDLGHRITQKCASGLKGLISWLILLLWWVLSATYLDFCFPFNPDLSSDWFLSKSCQLQHDVACFPVPRLWPPAFFWVFFFLLVSSDNCV